AFSRQFSASLRTRTFAKDANVWGTLRAIADTAIAGLSSPSVRGRLLRPERFLRSDRRTRVPRPLTMPRRQADGWPPTHDQSLPASAVPAPARFVSGSWTQSAAHTAAAPPSCDRFPAAPDVPLRGPATLVWNWHPQGWAVFCATRCCLAERPTPANS